MDDTQRSNAAMTDLKSPYVYFGGKARIAPVVWRAFGDVPNFVDPFMGSNAILLARPGWPPERPWTETVNDIDGFISNFWRATTADRKAVAEYADWPSNENDLHARHVWLRSQTDVLRERLEGDPDYYDAKIAGWWVWGMAQWIGGGFCGPSGVGPWHVVEDEDGLKRLVKGDAGVGVSRRRLHLGDAGIGVTRQLLHLGTASRGVTRILPHLSPGNAFGHTTTSGILEWISELSDRMRLVRVACGDWSRVTGPAVTTYHGLTAVFLDPPYSFEANRDMGCYSHDSGTIAHDVAKWAIANGDNPLLRIALCGYEGEHDMPATWRKYEWKAQGGYANLGDNQGRENCHRERIWFSPHCLPLDGEDEQQLDMFEDDEP